MSVPGTLLDTSTSPATTIAAVRLTVQRRAAHVRVRNKTDDNWSLAIGLEGLTLRVTAEGITSAAWIDTLIQRWGAGTVLPYQVAFDDGGAHDGSFAIEQLDEAPNPEQRRRFTLVLVSSGAVTYTPAP